MMAVGYYDQSRMFLMRNLWSTKWGIDGYCWISCDYFTSPDHAADFLVIQPSSQNNMDPVLRRRTAPTPRFLVIIAWTFHVMAS